MPPLAGARVLVWGFGRHGGGLAAARFCAARGAQVSILDRADPSDLGDDGRAALAAGWTWQRGDGGHPALAKADLVVPSPAIPPRAWPAAHPPIASPEALALAEHRGPRVAITGSKGKSTTTALLAGLLGWTACGNSWRPLAAAVDELGPDAPLAIELSSFQLWYLRELQPRFAGAVLTSLAVDHLDWHPDVAHYRASKLALLGWTDRVAADPSATASRGVAPVTFADDRFRTADGAVIATRADLQPPGAHNAANACLALAMAEALGAPRDQLASRLRSVEPLPHRLRTVHQQAGIAFVDDSIATTPESAIAGLRSFSGPLAVILGGSDKGADFTALAAAVVARGARPVLIGATAPRIAASLRAAGIDAPIALDLPSAVRLARGLVAGGGTVLLSPACASFDMFQGFEDRGRRFATAARG
jgi:UDP-N-acetylmuramoylalanine--D-glutamate ligase